MRLSHFFLIDMKKILFLFILTLHSLSATYLFQFEEELKEEQKLELFELIMKGEAPRLFYDSDPIDLKQACHQLVPSISLQWIPPSIWQLGVLYLFFHEPMIREGILAYCHEEWEPLEYEEVIHSLLPTAERLEEIVKCFDHHSLSRPHLSELFFQMNQSLVTLYQRANSSDIEMLQFIISKLPPFREWREREFPFWRSSWIHNLDAVKLFYSAIRDINLLSEVIKIERRAHENGEWVLYRGYSGSGYPSTLQLNAASSHALSFGSTLLGGAFFSLEAAAITYAKPDMPSIHSFMALRVSPEEMRDLFRIGPLHPFIQLLSDGEMFHAHTKIATKNSESIARNGYFMKCNKNCIDPVGYMTAPSMTTKELEERFLELCERSSHIFYSLGKAL